MIRDLRNVSNTYAPRVTRHVTARVHRSRGNPRERGLLPRRLLRAAGADRCGPGWGPFTRLSTPVVEARPSGQITGADLAATFAPFPPIRSHHSFRAFVGKAVELLEGGVHLLLIDVFPPTTRDPQGIHSAIWQELVGEHGGFTLPSEAPLTLVSYRAPPGPEAYVEPTAVGTPLINMPIFLTCESYVPVPLEPTYQAAWEAVPEFSRNVIEGRPND